MSRSFCGLVQRRIRKVAQILTLSSVTGVLRCAVSFLAFTKYANPDPSSGSATPRALSFSLKFASIAMKRPYNHLQEMIMSVTARKRGINITRFLSSGASSHPGGKFHPGCGHAGHSIAKSPSQRPLDDAEGCPAPPRLRSLIWRHCRTHRDIS